MMLVRINDAVIRELTEQAQARFPPETGGVLLGCIAIEAIGVVMASNGSGPGVQHGRFRFRPDQDSRLREHGLRPRSSLAMRCPWTRRGMVTPPLRTLTNVSSVAHELPVRKD